MDLDDIGTLDRMKDEFFALLLLSSLPLSVVLGVGI